jgi:acyl-CoA reductase-like NAD-dependent aldehyde dehydrogenase
MQQRVPVLKTYKIYIGGNFERSESGRYFPFPNKSGTTIANVCLSSRKDIRNAVVAARGAFKSWSSRSAYNRSQILYRMAEMAEGKRLQFIEELILEGVSRNAAVLQVHEAIDRLIYYAGWCDKYTQVYGSINPVASPHFNFSVPEPMGVVALIAPESSTLPGLVTAIAPVIASGNTCVVLAASNAPMSSLTFTEVLETSDLPGGVANVLTGNLDELLGTLSTHMDINGVAYFGNNEEIIKTIQQNAALNVRRVKFYDIRKAGMKALENPYRIIDFTEIKTTWHPVGI